VTGSILRPSLFEGAKIQKNARSYEMGQNFKFKPYSTSFDWFLCVFRK